jgi:hypothetical protein
MEVEYDLTPDDLYAFQWRSVFVSPRGRRARRTAHLVWVLLVLLFATLPVIGANGVAFSRVNLTVILVTTLVVLLFAWSLERWLIRLTILKQLKHEKPGKGLLARHRIVLSQDGLIESTAVGESRTSWAGVDRIEQDPHNIYIYTSLAAAHVIPKRAFRNPQETDAFYQFSRARKEAAG